LGTLPVHEEQAAPHLDRPHIVRNHAQEEEEARKLDHVALARHVAQLLVGRAQHAVDDGVHCLCAPRPATVLRLRSLSPSAAHAPPPFIPTVEVRHSSPSPPWIAAFDFVSTLASCNSINSQPEPSHKQPAGTAGGGAGRPLAHAPRMSLSAPAVSSATAHGSSVRRYSSSSLLGAARGSSRRAAACCFKTRISSSSDCRSNRTAQ